MQRSRKEMDSSLSLPSLSDPPQSLSPHPSLLLSSPLASASSLMHARNQIKPVPQAQKKKGRRKKKKRSALHAASPSALPLHDQSILSSLSLATQPTSSPLPPSSSLPPHPSSSSSSSSLESLPSSHSSIPSSKLSTGFHSDYSDSHCSDTDSAHPSRPTKETNSGDSTRVCPICDSPACADFGGPLCKGPPDSELMDTDSYDSESESCDLQLEFGVKESLIVAGVVQC